MKILVSRAPLLATASILLLQAGPQRDLSTNSIGMKLALVPAGTSSMGSPDDEQERDEEELPHAVRITKPFYIGIHEVTQADYEKVMGKADSATFNKSNGGGPDHPMENVLWEEAGEFCKKLSELPEEKRAGRRYRLPTEAEWEYACRAGTTTPFHFGNALSSKQANSNGNFPYGSPEKGPYLRRTAKVGSYQPNAFGLYDMHGNVAEWCADWYQKDYYQKSAKEDPSGPIEGVLPSGFGNFYRVVRGGSWLDEARACRAAYRQRAMPENRYRLIGFRVVCEVEGKK